VYVRGEGEEEGEEEEPTMLGLGENKRRKVGWVIILCSCFYLVNLSLVRLG
jgi:hypothetical protein